MSIYPSEDVARFDQQFAETDYERSQRQADARSARSLTAPSRIDPLLAAHHKFMAIAHRRPAPLGLDPSPDAMERRACEVEEIMLAMRDYALAIVEDSASVMSLPTDLRSGIIAAFNDMAGDVRGTLNVAVEEAQEESQAVRRIAR